MASTDRRARTRTRAAAALALLLAAAATWPAAAAGRGRLVHEARSAFSWIRVRDDGPRRLLLFVRQGGVEVVETAVDLRAPHLLQLSYARAMFATLLYRPGPSRCLVVGLGGGAMVLFLNHFFPEVRVDAVEIDPEVVRIAREYFGAGPGPRTRVFAEDAAEFLGRTGERYDVILMDAFLTPGEGTDPAGVPLSLKTAAFLGRLGARLSPGGAVAFNLHDGPGTPADLAALRAAFPTLDVYQVRGTGNVVAVAVAGDRPGEDRLQDRARALDRRRDHGFSFERLLADRARP